MKIINTLIKATTLAVLLIFLFDASGVVASQKRRIITVKGEGLFLDYSEQIYWSEEQFNQEYEKYSANKVKYTKDFIKRFSDVFLKDSLKADMWSISFESQYTIKINKSVCFTLIHCRIIGAATGSVKNPYYRTEWLLVPILGNRIDLYSFRYLTDKIIIYEGKANRIPIKIIFKFPRPIDHCHYHIWYK